MTASTVSGRSGESTTFQAHVTLPLLTSPGPVAWNFGDGSVSFHEGTQATHVYGFPGTFFVAASMALGNRKSVNNSDALLPITIAPSAALTDRDGLGRITIDLTASSPGAPVIPVGGHIAAVGSVVQGPTNTTYRWAVSALDFDFGDGSTATKASGDPFPVQHTYSTPGIRALVLYVTTKNLSAEGDAADLRITSVGQTVAIGPYRLATDSGSTASSGWIATFESLQRELRLMGFLFRIAVELP